MIESVMPGRPAALAGVRQGDKIVAVNWSPVTSVADLRDAAASQRAILAHEPMAAVCFWS
ncbi:MAG: PDZ domain-containing protein [Rhizobiales bacterium]|nr:PDZ domain-containing protein [Hyphomicrobiales bacterium]